MEKIISKYYKKTIDRIKKINQSEIIIISTALVLLIILVRFIKIQDKYVTVRIRIDGEYYTEFENNTNRLNTSPWMIEQLEVGLKEKNTSRKTIVEITNIEKTLNNSGSYDASIDAKIFATYNRATGQYSFKDKLIGIGSEIEIRPGKVYIKGKIIDMNNNTPELLSEEKWVTVRVRHDIPIQLLEKLKKDKIYYSQNGQEIAKIKKVEVYEVGTLNFSSETDIELKSYYKPKSQEYFYKDELISANDKIDIVFNDFAIKGTIVEINPDDSKRIPKEISIKAQWYDVEPWQINQVMKKPSMLEEITKNPIVQITNAYTTNRPVKYLAGYGEVYSYNNDFRKDLHLNLKIKGYESNGRLFFGNGQRVKVGDSIIIFTDKITCYVQVQNIDSVKDVADKK